MKIPKRLQPLIEDGLVSAVIGRLMSGKEADVYIVRCGSETRCAKVYKESMKRSFKSATQYQEGRKERNSRRARAMQKGSKFGRKQQEVSWQSAEVDALYLLAKAGVRVPQPHGCLDGVLLMDLVTDQHGDVAPRLADVELTAEQARDFHARLMTDVIRMLLAGIVHGDLSEFNVLVDEQGPVIIDLPQAVNAAANNNAEAILMRDVGTITSFLAQFAPELADGQFARELWMLYENADLSDATVLTGHFDEPESPPDVDGVLVEINAVLAEEEERQARLQEFSSEE